MKVTPLILFLTFLMYGCSNSNSETVKNKHIEKLQVENDSLKLIVNKNKSSEKHLVLTSLTFQKNDAEQAMKLYLSLFDNAEIIDVQRWGAGGPGKEGAIMQAVFELNGHRFMVSDSPPIHNWDFTPAVSTYIECANEDEIERLFSKLSENGEVAMPLDNYGFSQKFGWVVDQFGVSWQLNLNIDR